MSDLYSPEPEIAWALQVVFRLDHPKINKILSLLPQSVKARILEIVKSHEGEEIRLLKQVWFPRVAIPFDAFNPIREEVIQNGWSEVFAELATL